MPGHVKLGKAGEPDPDPSEYLIVSMDMKREDQMKPYDSKKSWWVPDGQGGYIESILESDDGKVAKVVVKGYEVKHEILDARLERVIIHTYLLLLNFRKEPTSLMNLVKSIHQSLRSARTWPT